MKTFYITTNGNGKLENLGGVILIIDKKMSKLTYHSAGL